MLTVGFNSVWDFPMELIQHNFWLGFPHWEKRNVVISSVST